MCRFCSQELSKTAYYRHLSDKTGTVCPGKKRSRVACDREGVSDEELACASRKSPRTLDSTFEICSSSSDNCESNPDEQDYALAFEYSPIERAGTPWQNVESISSDEISTKESSSEEEIWDDRETDNGSEPDDMNGQVKSVLSNIYFSCIFSPFISPIGACNYFTSRFLQDSLFIPCCNH